MKDKKPKSDDEDEGSKLIHEGLNSMKRSRRKGARPSVLLATRVFIIRMNVSRRKWESCLSYLTITTLMYWMN